MMENRDIQSILPHRYPFLLVDRIVEMEPGTRGVGIKNLTGNEWCLNGGSTYPPVLLLESLAQVGGIVLGSKAREENPNSRFIGLFAGGSDFQFQRSPVVGEQMILKEELSQSLAWKAVQVRSLRSRRLHDELIDSCLRMRFWVCIRRTSP